MKMRKFLILLLAAVLSVPPIAQAAKLETATVGDLNYSFFDDVATVEVTTYRKANLTIPSEVIYNGRLYRVEAIAPSAFKNNTYITTVELPATLVSIGSSAFQGCRMSTINFPESLIDIGSYAFANSYLKSVNIPASTVGLGSHIFDSCVRLKTAVVNSNISTLPTYIFYGCTKLTDVTLAAAIKKIGDYAFMNCGSLQSLPISIMVTALGVSAFEHCPAITEIEIPANVNSLGKRAFADNAQLTSIVVRPVEPPTISSTTFDSSVMRSTLTVVPSGCKPAYKRASVWASFGNLHEVGEVTTLGDINGDGFIDSSDVSALLEIVLSGITGEINLAADINNSGTIDSTDVSALLELVLGGD